MLFRKLRLKWQYAISELLIVVVGVLLALAADGWLESHRLRQAEQASLVRLAADMTFDIDDVSGNLDRTRRGLQAAHWLTNRDRKKKDPTSP